MPAKLAPAKAGGGAAWRFYSCGPDRQRGCETGVILLLLLWYNLYKAFNTREKDQKFSQDFDLTVRNSKA